MLETSLFRIFVILSVVLASGSAQAAVAAKTNELQATGLDVTVGDQTLLDRLTLEIKPRGADMATVCLCMWCSCPCPPAGPWVGYGARLCPSARAA